MKSSVTVTFAYCDNLLWSNGITIPEKDCNDVFFCNFVPVHRVYDRPPIYSSAPTISPCPSAAPARAAEARWDRCRAPARSPPSSCSPASPGCPRLDPGPWFWRYGFVKYNNLFDILKSIKMTHSSLVKFPLFVYPCTISSPCCNLIQNDHIKCREIITVIKLTRSGPKIPALRRAICSG